MRDNGPVTQHAHVLPPDATLMSTTDTQSRITYANDAFIAASGFSREELQGQHHNLVRHPDMPRAAFADMWKTLQGGEPWTALVKNRRSNGDHYWVRANAIPVVREGTTTGYMSVRTTPRTEEVAAAEALYARMRDGELGEHPLHKGLVRHQGLAAWRNPLQRLSVRSRLSMASLVLWPLLQLLAFGAGMRGASLAGFAVGSLGLLALVAWWLEAQIARPLALLNQQALAIATGATNEATQLDRVDEIGMSLRSVNQLGLMFRWLIDDVSAQVINLRSAIAEISQGNHDLSVRTEQSAARVQETAASMSEMNDVVRHSADVANQAQAHSSTSSTAAGYGREAMQGVVQVMGQIAADSHRIGEIIGVIDGIAFQTNILALNAAVEAARAGEQGRGFAVVAGEVRSLAQRSAEAAKAVRTLISSNTERVEAGRAQVDAAGAAMNDIVSQVSRVSGLISELSQAASTQRQGIGEIGEAVNQFDQITQQNAALVEQSAAASQSIATQAERLVEAVSVFQRDTPRGSAVQQRAWDGVERRGPDRAKNVTRLRTSATNTAAEENHAPVGRWAAH